jgi:hypothetical protein
MTKNPLENILNQLLPLHALAKDRDQKGATMGRKAMSAKNAKKPARKTKVADYSKTAEQFLDSLEKFCAAAKLFMDWLEPRANGIRMLYEETQDYNGKALLSEYNVRLANSYRSLQGLSQSLNPADLKKFVGEVQKLLEMTDKTYPNAVEKGKEFAAKVGKMNLEKMGVQFLSGLGAPKGPKGKPGDAPAPDDGCGEDCGDGCGGDCGGGCDGSCGGEPVEEEPADEEPKDPPKKSKKSKMKKLF